MEEVIIYPNVEAGDLVRCSNCGKVMLVPYGNEICPECGKVGTMAWFDDEQESDIDKLEQKDLKIFKSDKEVEYEDCFCGYETH